MILLTGLLSILSTTLCAQHVATGGQHAGAGSHPKTLFKPFALPALSVVIIRRTDQLQPSLQSFRAGPFYVPEPPPLFYSPTDMALGESLLGDILCTALDIFVFNPSEKKAKANKANKRR